jgi:glutamate-1-semialdehyde 2,1-aminomutase
MKAAAHKKIAEDPASDAAALFRAAEAALPGAGLGGYSLPEEARFIFAEGRGARFRAVGKAEYADYVCGAGALILGHSHPAVVAAAQRQIGRGAHMFGALSDVAATLAERLAADIPCAEKIAFATTGSEATAYAMRLARAYTGRDKVLKFEGAYHGNHDYALVSTFPSASLAIKPQADTGGQPAAVRETMLVAPYNDAKAARRIFAEHGGKIAAVIVEPVQRIIPATGDFLAALRELCDKHGAALIFDEVVTGFRLAYGGAQAALGIVPDIAAFGKIIGGGGPLAAVCGRADIINLADPRRRGQSNYAYFNGTLHGSPPAAAMTLAALDELAKPGVYQTLDNIAEKTRARAQQVLDANNIPALAARAGSLWQILFTEEMPRDYRQFCGGDLAAMRRLDLELLKRRQYILPGVRRFVSLAHGDAELEWLSDALDDACRATH